MNRRIFYFSLLSLAVTGCGSINNKSAMGDFEYAKEKEAQELSIPTGLNKPKKNTKFFISDDINHKGPVGQSVDVRAPSLVLPVASSSRVVPGTTDSKIWFDQVLEDTDLKTFLTDALREQLVNDGVELTAINTEDTVFESDWHHNEETSGYWLFKTVDSSESVRYSYSFESKPHGRSVALTVKLIDYMRTDINGASKTMDLIDKQRAEMAMLNQIIAQVDFKYRLKQRENRLMRANQKFVTIGENAQAEPAYIAEIDIEMLWSNMPLFFADYGFEITDLNESKKIYFVDFVKPENSLWSVIWGDDVPVIDVDEAKYQFVLSDEKGKTSVTIYDVDGNVLPIETLERIFPVMEAGLSFRDAL
ncbi:outer membrane protein assembly factor BamC [Colwellia sp. MB02u-14]|uniref:outer membrane protein assembly factor BamC n=1 Tax=Colwellia sp. MB02u-14 TaxID=2759815 RepID=UPI0015F3C5BD|nr:outer membrane protein assembly factor BamC [Colwellia sp. MB02u-14]MBA6304290.1 outer membrane protein assembly factor BamC [Colwellia sp. MB02u-14]